jgi:hypothetical protein
LLKTVGFFPLIFFYQAIVFISWCVTLWSLNKIMLQMALRIKRHREALVIVGSLIFSRGWGKLGYLILGLTEGLNS